MPTLTRVKTTVEPFYAPVRTGFPGAEDVDPTTFVVSTALVAPGVDPAPSDFATASWTTSNGAHYATHAYAGNYAAGTWILWVKINIATGDTPKIKSGPIILTDA